MVVLEGLEVFDEAAAKEALFHKERNVEPELKPPCYKVEDAFSDFGQRSDVELVLEVHLAVGLVLKLV